MIEKYKSGDFCKDSLCEHVLSLMEGNKRFCKGCKAKEFHKYLDSNGFRIIRMRPFTKWIAEHLEKCLEKNDRRGKGPWETADVSALFCKLNEELREVDDAVCNGGRALVCEENRTPEAMSHLQDELFDVVATAGMIAARMDDNVSRFRRGHVVAGSGDNR